MRDAVLAQRELVFRKGLYDVLNVCREDFISIANGENLLTLLRAKYLELVTDALQPIQLK